MESFVGAISPHGTVQDTHLSPISRAPLVIHIQDIHGHEEAQKNIARLIGGIQEAAGVSLVGVEGAMGDFDIAPFRNFPDAETTHAVASALLTQGDIGGPEFAGFTLPTPPLLWGVENPARYEGNIQALKASREQASALISLLDELKSETEALKAFMYSTELKELDRRFQDYREQRLGLGEYVLALKDQAKGIKAPELRRMIDCLSLERILDFSKVEQERGRLADRLATALSPKALADLVHLSVGHRSGRLSFSSYWKTLKRDCRRVGISLDGYPHLSAYADYVSLAEQINRNALLGELSDLETTVFLRLAGGPDQKRLVSIDRDLRRLYALARQSMTMTEWTAYKSTRREALQLPRRLHAILPRSMNRPRSVSTFDLSLLIEPFEQFCRLAETRNGFMVDNVLTKMKVENIRSAVLVGGGFHSQGLKEILRSRGASYLEVTPKMTEVPRTQGYLDVFARSAVPIEKVLAGERIYLVRPLSFASTQPKGPFRANSTFVRERTLADQAVLQAPKNPADQASHRRRVNDNAARAGLPIRVDKIEVEENVKRVGLSVGGKRFESRAVRTGNRWAVTSTLRWGLPLTALQRRAEVLIDAVPWAIFNKTFREDAFIIGVGSLAFFSSSPWVIPLGFAAFIARHAKNVEMDYRQSRPPGFLSSNVPRAPLGWKVRYWASLSAGGLLLHGLLLAPLAVAALGPVGFWMGMAWASALAGVGGHGYYSDWALKWVSRTGANGYFAPLLITRHSPPLEPFVYRPADPESILFGWIQNLGTAYISASGPTLTNVTRTLLSTLDRMEDRHPQIREYLWAVLLARFQNSEEPDLGFISQGLVEGLQTSPNLSLARLDEMGDILAARLPLATGYSLEKLVWVLVAGIGRRPDSSSRFLAAMAVLEARLRRRDGEIPKGLLKGLMHAFQETGPLDAEVWGPVLEALADRLPNAKASAREDIAGALAMGLGQVDRGHSKMQAPMDLLREQLQRSLGQDFDVLLQGLARGFAGAKEMDAEALGPIVIALLGRIDHTEGRALELLIAATVSLIVKSRDPSPPIKNAVDVLLSRLPVANPMRLEHMLQGLANGLGKTIDVAPEILDPLLAALVDLNSKAGADVAGPLVRGIVIGLGKAKENRAGLANPAGVVLQRLKGDSKNYSGLVEIVASGFEAGSDVDPQNVAPILSVLGERLPSAGAHALPSLVRALVLGLGKAGAWHADMESSRADLLEKLRVVQEEDLDGIAAGLAEGFSSLDKVRPEVLGTVLESIADRLGTARPYALENLIAALTAGLGNATASWAGLTHCVNALSAPRGSNDDFHLPHYAKGLENGFSKATVLAPEVMSPVLEAIASHGQALPENQRSRLLGALALGLRGTPRLGLDAHVGILEMARMRFGEDPVALDLYAASLALGLQTADVDYFANRLVTLARSLIPKPLVAVLDQKAFSEKDLLKIFDFYGSSSNWALRNEVFNRLVQHPDPELSTMLVDILNKKSLTVVETLGLNVLAARAPADGALPELAQQSILNRFLSDDPAIGQWPRESADAIASCLPKIISGDLLMPRALDRLETGSERSIRTHLRLVENVARQSPLDTRYLPALTEAAIRHHEEEWEPFWVDVFLTFNLDDVFDDLRRARLYPLLTSLLERRLRTAPVEERSLIHEKINLLLADVAAALDGVPPADPGDSNGWAAVVSIMGLAAAVKPLLPLEWTPNLKALSEKAAKRLGTSPRSTVQTLQDLKAFGAFGSPTIIGQALFAQWSVSQKMGTDMQNLFARGMFDPRAFTQALVEGGRSEDAEFLPPNARADLYALHRWLPPAVARTELTRFVKQETHPALRDSLLKELEKLHSNAGDLLRGVFGERAVAALQALVPQLQQLPAAGFSESPLARVSNLSETIQGLTRARAVLGEGVFQGIVGAWQNVVAFRDILPLRPETRETHVDGYVLPERFAEGPTRDRPAQFLTIAQQGRTGEASEFNPARRRTQALYQAKFVPANFAVLDLMARHSQAMTKGVALAVLTLAEKMVEAFVEMDPPRNRWAREEFDARFSTALRARWSGLSDRDKIDEASLSLVIGLGGPDSGAPHTLHSLINRVHTAADQSKTRLMGRGHANLRIGMGDRLIWVSDLGDYPLVQNGEIRNRPLKGLLEALEPAVDVYVDPFVISDNHLYWGAALGYHRVEFSASLESPDAGGHLRLYYTEPAATGGNFLRIKFMASVLRGLGVHVRTPTDNTASLEAVLDKDHGAKDRDHIYRTYVLALRLLHSTRDMDSNLNGLINLRGDRAVEGLVLEMAKAYLAEGQPASFGGEKVDLWSAYQKYKENEPIRNSLRGRFNQQLRELGFPTIPLSVPFGQRVLDDYVTRPIRLGLVRGQLVRGPDDRPVKNPAYDPLPGMLSRVLADESEAVRAALALDALPGEVGPWELLGSVGKLVAVGGQLELGQGQWVVIHGLRDPASGQMRYAVFQESVGEGPRTPLRVDSFCERMAQKGTPLHPIDKPSRPQIDLANRLLKSMPNGTHGPPVIRGLGASPGTGLGVIGRVSFDRNGTAEGRVGESVLMLPFTTPDDLKAIQAARAVVTTGGGLLSHAGITTREFGVPAVIAQTAKWGAPEGKTVFVGDAEKPLPAEKGPEGLWVTRMARVPETAVHEGDVVVVNGRDGTLTVFSPESQPSISEMWDQMKRLSNGEDDLTGLVAGLSQNLENGAVGPERWEAVLTELIGFALLALLGTDLFQDERWKYQTFRRMLGDKSGEMPPHIALRFRLAARDFVQNEKEALQGEFFRVLASREGPRLPHGNAEPIPRSLSMRIGKWEPWISEMGLMDTEWRALRQTADRLDQEEKEDRARAGLAIHQAAMRLASRKTAEADLPEVRRLLRRATEAGLSLQSVRRVVCVCTGNTDRSPMFERLLNPSLAGRGPVEVLSRGLNASPGKPLSENAARVLGELGADGKTPHASAPLTSADLAGVDLVLAMTQDHVTAILKQYPGLAGKVHRLSDYGGFLTRGDLRDPFGAGIDTYRATGGELKAAAEAVASRIDGAAALQSLAEKERAWSEKKTRDVGRMTRGVYSLGEIDADWVSLVGGKSAQLGEILAVVREQGGDVPEGFAIATGAFERFLDDNPGLRKAFREAVENVNAQWANLPLDQEERRAWIQTASAQIRRVILYGTLDDRAGGLGAEILSAVDAHGLGDADLAVRSSAVEEDTPEAAFAGVAESFLSTRREELLEKVKENWASFFLPRGLEYRAAHGKAPADVKPATLVQRMADADTAGVAFTINPATGEDVVLINAAYGLAEGVVSGIVQGDLYTARKSDGVEIDFASIGRKRLRIVPHVGGSGTETASVDEADQARRSLPPETVSRLALLATALEGHFGHPVDVEFAVSKSRIAILQARPVTTARREESGGDLLGRRAARDMSSPPLHPNAAGSPVTPSIDGRVGGAALLRKYLLGSPAAPVGFDVVLQREGGAADRASFRDLALSIAVPPPGEEEWLRELIGLLEKGETVQAAQWDAWAHRFESLDQNSNPTQGEDEAQKSVDKVLDAATRRVVSLASLASAEERVPIFQETLPLMAILHQWRKSFLSERGGLNISVDQESQALDMALTLHLAFGDEPNIYQEAWARPYPETQDTLRRWGLETRPQSLARALEENRPIVVDVSELFEPGDRAPADESLSQGRIHATLRDLKVAREKHPGSKSVIGLTVKNTAIDRPLFNQEIDPAIKRLVRELDAHVLLAGERPLLKNGRLSARRVARALGTDVAPILYTLDVENWGDLGEALVKVIMSAGLVRDAVAQTMEKLKQERYIRIQA